MFWHFRGGGSGRCGKNLHFLFFFFWRLPLTAWNHHPSSFFFQSAFFIHPPFILQLISFSACFMSAIEYQNEIIVTIFIFITIFISHFVQIPHWSKYSDLRPSSVNSLQGESFWFSVLLEMLVLPYIASKVFWSFNMNISKIASWY